MKNKSNIYNRMLVYGLAFLISLIWLNIYLYEPVYTYVKQNVTESNIVPYAIFILLFLAAVLLGQVLFAKIDVNKLVDALPSWLSNLISIAIILGNLGLLGLCYLHEMDLFDAPGEELLLYHQSNKIVLVALIGMFCMAVILIERYQWKQEKSDKLKQLAYAIGILTIGVIYCYALFTPNAFNRFYDLYHNNAYFNSVFSAMRGAPRSEMNSSVYGFYGILLAPIVNLLGGSTVSFYYAICGLALVSFLCMSYAICVLVKSDLVRWLSIISLIVITTSMHWGIYLQLIPHRVIFPSIVLAYIAFAYEHKMQSKIYEIVGYVICGLAMIWNFETGFVTLIAYVCYFALESFKTYTLKQGKLYLSLLLYAIKIIATFIGSYVLVNIVNLCMGGAWLSVKTYIFPLMNSSYITGDLTSDYQTGVVAWVFIAAMAFLFVYNGLAKTRLNPKFEEYSSSKRANVLFALAVIALGQMTYYINRSAYGNLTIVHFMAIAMLGIIANHCIYHYVHNKKEISIVNNLYRGFAYITVMVLMAIVAAGVYNYASCQQFRQDNSYREMTEVSWVETQIADVCPENTRALGLSIAELYSDLGWDSYYYMIDFADTGVYPPAYDYLDEELNVNLTEPILIDEHAIEVIEERVDLSGFYERFHLEEVFDLYETELYYYTLK